MERFLPRKPRLRHDTPGWVENPEHFVTVCCQPPGQNHLCREAVARGILDALCFYHRANRCRVELLVLMPDHFHMILRVPDSVDLALWIYALKRWLCRRHGIIFQENFFDHRLRSIPSAQQKWKYVNMNPVRAGYVSRPENWPYRYTLSDFESGRAGCSNPPRSTPKVHRPMRRSRRDRPT